MQEELPLQRRSEPKLSIVGLLFLAIIFTVATYFGTNLIRFGRLLRPSVGDFVVLAKRDCVSTVRAIKEYQNDTGRFPLRIHDLQPKYLQAIPVPNQDIDDEKFFEWTSSHYLISYDFRQASEGWSVDGPSFHHSLPLPVVKIVDEQQSKTSGSLTEESRP